MVAAALPFLRRDVAVAAAEAGAGGGGGAGWGGGGVCATRWRLDLRADDGVSTDVEVGGESELFLRFRALEGGAGAWGMGAGVAEESPGMDDEAGVDEAAWLAA